MPTTVVKTIGTTGRDYSNLQAWEDACPAGLVVADQIWRGECYNDSEFVDSSGSAILTIAGQTTDATRYIELTVASGQSFQDHASVRTNALRYNASNGVGIRETTGYNAVINVNAAVVYTRISRIQIKHEGTGQILAGGILQTLKDMLTYGQARFCQTSSSLIVNITHFQTGSGGNGILLDNPGGSTVVGCTFVRTTDQSAAGTGVVSNYLTDTVKSCAFFGYSTAASGSFTGSGNNATQLASGLPGSSNQHSVTFTATAPFTQAAVSGADLRAIAATSLAANGVLDATNAPNDISATARANPPTIGAWEYVTPVGRTTKNTRPYPLGLSLGIRRGLGGRT